MSFYADFIVYVAIAIGLGLLFASVVFPNPVYADSNEQYCPTITAIYGVCSPELVQNWLNNKNKAPLPKTTSEVAKPPGTSLINQTETFALNQSKPGAQTPVCYCAVDYGERCILNGKVTIKAAYSYKCERWVKNILKDIETPKEPIRRYIWLYQ